MWSPTAGRNVRAPRVRGTPMPLNGRKTEIFPPFFPTLTVCAPAPLPVHWRERPPAEIKERKGKRGQRRPASLFFVSLPLTPTKHPTVRRVRATPASARAFKEGSSAAPPRGDGLRSLKNSIGEIDASAAQDKAAELFGELQTFWEKSDDKAAIIGLTVASILALITANAVSGAISRVPVISDLLEIIGLLYSGYFAYKNLFFKPDRQALLKKIDATLEKVFPKV